MIKIDAGSQFSFKLHYCLPKFILCPIHTDKNIDWRTSPKGLEYIKNNIFLCQQIKRQPSSVLSLSSETCIILTLSRHWLKPWQQLCAPALALPPHFGGGWNGSTPCPQRPWHTPGKYLKGCCHRAGLQRQAIQRFLVTEGLWIAVMVLLPVPLSWSWTRAGEAPSHSKWDWMQFSFHTDAPLTSNYPVSTLPHIFFKWDVNPEMTMSKLHKLPDYDE